jgi:cobalt/nickel transport system permease protein
VHIPDGFLSTPVWIAMDGAALPAVSLMARRAQRGFDDAKAPLLGVMGAFVFAAQMINIPLGAGTSGHLLGGALLAYTLGPSAASLVMTAILAIQALVFQDGGVLALGANTLNMAFSGVLAGYLPYALWGGGRYRKLAIFLGAALSVIASAAMALAELLLSGMPLTRATWGASGVAFLAAAILEGAITVAVIGAMERIQPNLVRRPRHGRPAVLAVVLGSAVALAACGFLIASSQPDTLEGLAEATGIAARARILFATPLSGYQAAFLNAGWLAKAVAGVAGLLAAYGLSTVIGRFMARNGRS